MATVTPTLVKQLRDQTGVGMSKCKEALEHSGGDMEGAVAFLRKAGMTSAAKKEGRTAKEGTIISHETDEILAIVEVNAETDFVVKNERFQEFCRAIAEEVAVKKPASLEEFLQAPYSKDPQITVDQFRSLLIQTIGENIQIRRIAFFEKDKSKSFGVYSHIGGKILSIVVFNGAGEEPTARHIAMHVAAAAPEFLSPEEVPQEIIQKEQEIARSQVSGKPENIIEKILEGKLNAFLDLCCLNRQKYIRDDSLSVGQFVKQHGSIVDKDLSIEKFVRWSVGQ